MTKTRNIQRQKEMFKLAEQWKKSTLTKKQFCLEHSLNINTFTYWAQKYRKNKQKSNNSNFIELKISDNSLQNNSQIRLNYPNGVQAEIPANTNINIIRSLINL